MLLHFDDAWLSRFLILINHICNHFWCTGRSRWMTDSSNMITYFLKKRVKHSLLKRKTLAFNNNLLKKTKTKTKNKNKTKHTPSDQAFSFFFSFSKFLFFSFPFFSVCGGVWVQCVCVTGDIFHIVSKLCQKWGHVYIVHFLSLLKFAHVGYFEEIGG